MTENAGGARIASVPRSREMIEIARFARSRLGSSVAFESPGPDV